ncbi:hypothetical protein Patl1_34074 [Pistacia atlantica]|uniref:Uncharacterized protein n=1 Tax=Pistacia atlantica TaxID=434234 RepID=A0ACC0ZR30_9ROSI|nr:hypothetical protein Patl1_34074 [Pistacia atlantica]
MDSRLFEAVANNDRGAFDNLVQDNEGILKQRTDYHLNTVLHLASRFRHFELVKDIIELHPEMVETVNKKLETPLHEACRQGRADAVMLLLETKPWVTTKLNYENESAFFIACRQGHLDVVKLMMNQSWLMDFEEDGIDLTALHVATAMGHTEIVQNILEVRPNFARKSNKNGYSPLHCACSRGYLEITRLFLRLDQDLAVQYNDKGYTPLHLAAIHGKVPILEEFMLSSPTSFQYLTKEGETVCHLAVRFNQYDALVCLANFFISSDLLLKKDQCGNTILHLAVSRGNYQLAMYIVNTAKEILNCRNNKGHTVLEILELSPGNAESKQLKKAVKAAAGKSTELLPLLAGAQETNARHQTLENSKDILETKNRSLLQYLIDIGNGCELPLDFKLGYQPEVVPTPSSSMSAKSRKDSGECLIKEKYDSHDSSRIKLQIQKEKLDMLTSRPRHKRISKSCGFLPTPSMEPMSTKDLLEAPPFEKPEIQDDKPLEPVSLTEAKDLCDLKEFRTLRDIHRRELNQLSKSRNKKQKHYEIHREALQNARNTIIMVAILIATVTFTAGTNPPGGVFQEGPLKGKSTVGRTTAFKVFIVSNNIAFFTSLCIVVVLVSIIPFRRKQMMKILVITHKVMWVAVSFMAIAYIAATWVTMPHCRESGWMFEVLLAISAGTLGTSVLVSGNCADKTLVKEVEVEGRER